MTEQEVFLRVHQIAESDAENLRLLAAEIAQECHRPSRIVLENWVSSPQSRGIPDAAICTDLKELAVGEMLQRAPSVEPGVRVHFMQIVAVQHLEFRELLLTVLEPLLKDLRPAGDTRTCDQAYILIRKLVTVAAADAGKFKSESEFLALDEDERSGEIKQWTKSKTWTDILPPK